MTDSISAVSASSASSSSSSSSSATASTKLTDSTKAKLEALGVDTSNISTEMEGEIALQEAQEQKAQSGQSSANSSAEEIIKCQAETLAAQVGASVSDNDTADTILSKISSKIYELRAQAGSDEEKLAQVQNYEEAYASISGSYTSMQSSQSKLTSSMSAMASYNKIYQNLN